MAIAMSAIFQTILGLIRHPKATAERHIAFKIVVNLALFFMNKIFVYGTLQRGMYNHFYMCDKYVENCTNLW